MRQWLKTFLLIPVGIILAVLICEIGLWAFGIEYPHFYEFEPVIGARLRPGLKGYWLKEGCGYVRINSDGLRDREYSLAKPPGTVRIAVLGDSFTEALQVNQDEGFCSVLERDLQKCDTLKGRRVEVLNFGVAGYGTAQELLTLRHRVWKYNPDVVLLEFTPGNDISDNSPKLNDGQSYPFFVLRNGKLVLDDSRLQRLEAIKENFEKYRNWQGDIIAWWLAFRNDSSRILQLIDRTEELAQQQQRTKDLKENRQGVAGAAMFTEIYHEPKDETWKEAWRITEAVLLRMRDEVVQRGAQFYVVVATSSTQVHPDPTVRNGLANYPGVADVFYPDHWVEKVCRSHDIPVLLLGPPFQAHVMKNPVYLHGFRTTFRDTLGSGHWNPDGHRLAGETIARWLGPQISH
jgi:hypothetical protein